MATFGERFRQLRKEKDLTQEQLAEIFYTNKGSISKYEHDKQVPEIELLKKLADFFGVSVDYLLGRSDTRNSDVIEEAMFDQKKFRDLLLRARGDRTNEEYAKQSGVSRPYISAYLNLKRETPPSPEVIKQLASVAQNSVTYEELMEAAGYIVRDHTQPWRPVITSKDEKDIAKDLERIMNDLTQADGLMFYNEPITDEDKKLLRDAIDVGLRAVKQRNKAKYTPKKYRHNNNA
jgi:transcriptional regulator with XRE-family HTH domain